MTAQPEPGDFDALVRQPGDASIARQKASGQLRRLAPLWNRAYDQLHSAYDRHCAYTCFYQHDRASIDHFWPKNDYPQLAYEWCNYRLCSPRTNQFKGKKVGILDPFLVPDGLFELDLPGCQIRPSAGLGEQLTDAVSRTINLLRLNADDYLVQRRANLIVAFVEGHVSREHVRLMNPFIYDELTRQGAWDSVANLFAR